MNESLSNDARAALAFIRDHPGSKEGQIMDGLGFDRGRVNRAISQLTRYKLVIAAGDGSKWYVV